MRLVAPHRLPTRRTLVGSLAWLAWLIVQTLVAVMLAGVIAVIVVFLITHTAHANIVDTQHTATGIPIDVLFSLIGVLGSAIYLDIKKDVRILKRESSQRSVTLAKWGVYLRQLCKAAGIPFQTDQEDDK